MPELIQKAAQITQEAKNQVNELFKETQFSQSLLNINSLFDQILTRFKFQGALLDKDKDKNPITDFGPITNFMGEAIKLDKAVKKSDLTPKEEEKKKFLAKVDKLFNEIKEMDPESVLKSYSLPEDKLVIKGVAKKAKVEGFNTRKIDANYINDIILGIQILQDEQDAIDLASAQSVKELTPEDIEKDKNLQEMHAHPGDKLITDKDGKTSIKKGKKK